MTVSNTEASDYKQSIILNTTSNEVFEALTEKIEDWWSSVDNASNKVGDVFKVSFGPESYWVFRVLEIEEFSKVVWQCVESHQDHHLKGMDDEWLHSKLYWKIAALDQGVELQFLHKGLVSTGVCYEVCSAGWDFYILESLKSFIETGVGKAGEN